MYTPQLLYPIKCLVPPHPCVAALMTTSEMSEHSLLPEVKILSLLSDSSPSLLTSPAVVVGGRPCSVALERLSFTGEKLHELDRVIPVGAKSWDMDEILSFALEFAFQGRVNTPSRPVNNSPRTEHSLSD